MATNISCLSMIANVPYPLQHPVQSVLLHSKGEADVLLAIYVTFFIHGSIKLDKW